MVRLKLIKGATNVFTRILDAFYQTVALETTLSLLCYLFDSNFSVSRRRIIKNFEMARKCKKVAVDWFEAL
jgi:hypothetical protein